MITKFLKIYVNKDNLENQTQILDLLNTTTVVIINTRLWSCHCSKAEEAYESGDYVLAKQFLEEFDKSKYHNEKELIRAKWKEKEDKEKNRHEEQHNENEHEDGNE